MFRWSNSNSCVETSSIYKWLSVCGSYISLTICQIGLKFRIWLAHGPMVCILNWKKKNQNLLWNDFTCKPQKVPNKHRSNATTQRLRAGVVLHGEYLTGWRKRQRIGYQTGVVGFVTGWHCTWQNSFAAFHLSREVVARVVLTREHDVTSWVVLLYKRYWIENQIYIA